MLLYAAEEIEPGVGLRLECRGSESGQEFGPSVLCARLRNVGGSFRSLALGLGLRERGRAGAAAE